MGIMNTISKFLVGILLALLVVGALFCVTVRPAHAQASFTLQPIPSRPDGLTDSQWAIKRANYAFASSVFYGAQLSRGYFYNLTTPNKPLNHGNCGCWSAECFFCTDCAGGKTCGKLPGISRPATIQ